MNVYILLTASKVHVYTTRSRALKVCQRAERAGVRVEFMSAQARTGDPFTRAQSAFDRLHRPHLA